MAGPRITLPRLNLPPQPALPSNKLSAGVDPPASIPALAGPQAPGVDRRSVQNTTRTLTYTYFTIPGGITQLFYNNNQNEWLQVTLHLETAGPVDIGTSQDISPVGSGKGRSLSTGQDVLVTLPPAHRLYIVSNTVDRVSVSIAPYPWLYQIMSTIERLAASIPGGVASALGRFLKGGR